METLTVGRSAFLLPFTKVWIFVTFIHILYIFLGSNRCGYTNKSKCHGVSAVSSTFHCEWFPIVEGHKSASRDS